MDGFLIVSKVDRLEEYKQIADRYHVGFELNDFYDPKVLDDEAEQERIIQQYLQAGIPDDSTMHGAFFDIVVFSHDDKIAEISRMRLRQSMEIAKRIGVKAVIFHTNANPMLAGEIYDNNVIEKTTNCLEELLLDYPDINIYLENMFDATPRILVNISKRLSKYPNYGICLDYAHAAISRLPMGDWVEALAPYLSHIHINDNDLKVDLHMPLGSGSINWNQFAKYYRTTFDGCTVLIETTNPEDQIQSLNYLRDNFVGLFRNEPR
ncbi:MAG: hypothetical protein E7264_09995 [Lachnospiraceae bacterium]|nr:hypothetical protein [Lachnospiraceae bacterium]